MHQVLFKYLSYSFIYTFESQVFSYNKHRTAARAMDLLAVIYRGGI